MGYSMGSLKSLIHIDHLHCDTYSIHAEWLYKFILHSNIPWSIAFKNKLVEKRHVKKELSKD